MKSLAALLLLCDVVCWTRALNGPLPRAQCVALCADDVPRCAAALASTRADVRWCRRNLVRLCRYYGPAACRVFSPEAAA